MKATELSSAPWREAVSYRDSWPHEYVLSGARMVSASCSRWSVPACGPARGVAGIFVGRLVTYLFIGDYKYWLMTHWDALDLDDEQDYVLNRPLLFGDRRDFIIQPGDTGKREDYPANPPHLGRSGSTSAEA